MYFIEEQSAIPSVRIGTWCTSLTQSARTARVLCRELACRDTFVKLHAATPAEAHAAVDSLIRDGVDPEFLRAVSADFRRLADVCSKARQFRRVQCSLRPVDAYAQAHLAIMLFTRIVARTSEQRVTAVAVHPGVVDTGSFAQVYGAGGLSAGDGAAHVAHAADPATEVVNGGYYEGPLLGRPAPQACDDDAALRLWVATARLVMMRVVAGVLAGWVQDGRVAVAVVACLIYVGFLTHRYGELVGDPAPWKQTPWLIGAVLAGRGIALARKAVRPVSAPPPEGVLSAESEPVASFEGAVQGQPGGEHQSHRRRVSGAPVQLGHVVDVHPVHGGGQ